MAERTVRCLVTGRVQGVGYRQACRTTARSLDLVGWVRNLNSGEVELFAQGDAASVDRLVDWLWAGPPAAKVQGVETETVAPDATLRDFFIHPNPSKTR